MGFTDRAMDPLPEDADRAVLVGRVWNPAAAGPSIVVSRAGEVFDVTDAAPTMRDLCEADDPAGLVRSAKGQSLGALSDILANTPREVRDPAKPWLLAPSD